VYSNAIPILHIALVLHTSLAANTTSICWSCLSAPLTAIHVVTDVV
jgi:hypothetical protein